MSHCLICGEKKEDKPFTYADKKYHGLGIIKYQGERAKVCVACHSKVSNGELMSLHSQLPLSAMQYNYPKGVFVTKKYLSHEVITEYTGTVMTSKAEVDASSSKFIVNMFYDDPPEEEQVWINGTGIG